MEIDLSSLEDASGPRGTSHTLNKVELATSSFRRSGVLDGASIELYDSQMHQSKRIGTDSLRYDQYLPTAFDEETSERAEAVGIAFGFRYAWNACGLKVVKMAAIGTSHDYYLAPPSKLAEVVAALEVSGIEQGTTGQINQRMKAKIERIRPKGGKWLVVVAMANPLVVCIGNEGLADD